MGQQRPNNYERDMKHCIVFYKEMWELLFGYAAIADNTTWLSYALNPWPFSLPMLILLKWINFHSSMDN